MKNKFLLGAIALCCSAFSAFADGYTDGIDYYNAGQYANARTILERTINDASTNKALAYYYLGQIEILYKNYNEAKAYFDKGIAADPNLPYNYVGLGAYYLSQNNAKEADNNFKQASKLGKKNYKIPVEIARTYYFNDPDNKKSMDQVNKYLEKARKDSKFQEPSIYILEGDMLFYEGKLGDAAGKYEMAIRYDNDNPEGYVKYAKAYSRVNPEYGIQKLKELLSKQPNSALAQRELAERYYENDDWGAAVKQYAQYMNNPNHFPEDKARYCVLLYVYKQYGDVITVCDEILAEDPTDFQAQRLKMLSLYYTKKYDEALAVAEKFLNSPAKSPFGAIDYNAYGDILSELKRSEEALEQYNNALNIDPENLGTMKNIAFALSDLDRNQEAAEQFQAVVDKTAEEDITLLNQAAGLWYIAAYNTEDAALKKSDAIKGLECIEKVLASVPDNLNVMRRYAQLIEQREQKPNKVVADAYLNLIAALDKDPKNFTEKANWYDSAFITLYNYYDSIDDADSKTAVYERLKAVRGN